MSDASGLRTITSGIPENFVNKKTTDPADLLPKDNQWNTLNNGDNVEIKVEDFEDKQSIFQLINTKRLKNQ